MDVLFQILGLFFICLICAKAGELKGRQVEKLEQAKRLQQAVERTQEIKKMITGERAGNVPSPYLQSPKIVVVRAEQAGRLSGRLEVVQELINDLKRE